MFPFRLRRTNHFQLRTVKFCRDVWQIELLIRVLCLWGIHVLRYTVLGSNLKNKTTDKDINVDADSLIFMIGLSKERPILDHHAKAHVLDFMKSGGFRTDFMKSGRFHMDFTGEICQISHLKSTGFQVWNPPDFERPIVRNGKPYVSFLIQEERICCGFIDDSPHTYDTFPQRTVTLTSRKSLGLLIIAGHARKPSCNIHCSHQGGITDPELVSGSSEGKWEHL